MGGDQGVMLHQLFEQLTDLAATMEGVFLQLIAATDVDRCLLDFV